MKTWWYILRIFSKTTESEKTKLCESFFNDRVEIQNRSNRGGYDNGSKFYVDIYREYHRKSSQEQQGFN